jgi:hypothetical protein
MPTRTAIALVVLLLRGRRQIGNHFKRLTLLFDHSLRRRVGPRSGRLAPVGIVPSQRLENAPNKITTTRARYADLNHGAGSRGAAAPAKPNASYPKA